MARAWLGREGGEGVGRGSHNARAFCAHDERARKTGGTDVDSSANCNLACAHESDALTMSCALGCRPMQTTATAAAERLSCRSKCGCCSCNEKQLTSCVSKRGIYDCRCARMWHGKKLTMMKKRALCKSSSSTAEFLRFPIFGSRRLKRMTSCQSKHQVVQAIIERLKCSIQALLHPSLTAQFFNHLLAVEQVALRSQSQCGYICVSNAIGTSLLGHSSMTSKCTGRLALHDGGGSPL
jgi:hypothetical protein